jgi:fermentation-respiration switch protein FrsA (DUF1100 family)/ADP-ribosylglycohydrolase
LYLPTTTEYPRSRVTLILNTHGVSGNWSHSLYKHTWIEYWSSTESYIDGATRQTIDHLNSPEASPASEANDSAGAALGLSLLAFLDTTDETASIAAVRQHVSFSHNDPETVDSAEYFARSTILLLKGSSLTEALELAAKHNYDHLDASNYLEKAKAALSTPEHLKVDADLGLTCHHPEAFPLTLFYLLRNPTNLSQALNENPLAGGDNAARAIIIAIILTASNGWSDELTPLWAQLNKHQKLEAQLPSEALKPRRETLSFTNQEGNTLQATLELPVDSPRAFAIFAHCFTCGQSSRGATRITNALAKQDIATLRFDFTGLGRSEGDFAETSFLTNTQDLVAAANYLEENFAAPSILIGHSLGGTAVLATAHQLPSVKAIATVGSPADPTHVQHLFSQHLEEIKTNGSAEVSLAGRPFKIGKRFLDDVENHCQPCYIGDLKRDLLILHAPTDDIVGIENAAATYSAAKHPKSFISLTDTDHLLLKPGAAEQAADLISAWAKRSI